MFLYLVSLQQTFLPMNVAGNYLSRFYVVLLISLDANKEVQNKCVSSCVQFYFNLYNIPTLVDNKA